MKTIIILLFAICIFTNSNAQSSRLEPKQELLKLLSSKHDYERILTLPKRNASTFKTKYTQSYAKIKNNKHKIISFINSALKADAPALSKEFIFYKYQSPLSSDFDPKNRISLLTYYKIVKYSLENSKTLLPPLPEVPFK